MTKPMTPPAKPATKAAPFNEAAFRAELDTLLAAGKKEPALTHLISELPALLGTNRLNRKEKLKHLTFAGRMLQEAGLGKYGAQKLRRKAGNLARVIKRHGLRSRRTFVDLGCGAHEPLGLSVYFYVNGFENAFGSDFMPVSDKAYAALSMADILMDMYIYPEHHMLEGGDLDSYLARIKNFDLEALKRGDLDAGLARVAANVEFKCCDIVEAGITPGSVSFLISYAVFEHVMDIPGVTKHIFDLMEPGGLGFHYIDLADHRAYRHDGDYNEFSFLTEEDCAPNLNRLRVSEQVAAFEAAGFEILENIPKRKPVPEATHKQYLPRFAAMSEIDQDAHALRLVIRKPL